MSITPEVATLIAVGKAAITNSAPYFFVFSKVFLMPDLSAEPVDSDLIDSQTSPISAIKGASAKSVSHALKKRHWNPSFLNC
jgi:hypothetical protein